MEAGEALPAVPALAMPEAAGERRVAAAEWAPAVCLQSTAQRSGFVLFPLGKQEQQEWHEKTPNQRPPGELHGMLAYEYWEQLALVKLLLPSSRTEREFPGGRFCCSRKAGSSPAMRQQEGRRTQSGCCA